MKINQAFDALQKSGGIRAARVITENTKNLSWFNVWRMSRALRRGTPVAKIIGQKWFYGLRFYTNKYTLDPRPDTETLVSAVISDCDTDHNDPRILDLGTGTGCIIGALVKNIHNATGVGIDKSRGAVRVARRNMRTLGLSNRIQIRRLSFNYAHNFNEKFDIIVSNPPYIARNDTRVDSGAMHDPDIALYADNNGLAAYEIIAKNAKKWLKKRGNIYLEIGAGQGPDVRNIFLCAGWSFLRSECDLSGTERVLIFTLNK